MVVKGNMQELEQNIFGTITKNFKAKDFVAWKTKAVKELNKLMNGKEYDKYIINDIVNYLNNVYVTDETELFIIDNEAVGIEELDTLFNMVYGYNKIGINLQNVIAVDENTKRIMLKDFYEDIKKNIICVNIFETEKEVIEYLFVEGKDMTQLLENIIFLLNKSGESKKYDWKKNNNVIKIGEKYFVVKW